MPLTDTIARNYSDVQDCLAAKRPFRHRSCSAQDVDGVYTVWSYSTIVAKWSPGNVWVTDSKYSVTTSKQVGYIKRAWRV